MSTVASLSTSPVAWSTTPQCPWSVNSSRQQSAITTTLSPTASRTTARARWVIPSGRSAADPVASLSSGRGRPNRMMPGTPREPSRFDSTTSDSTVCWTTPGIDGTGRGSSTPSARNRGATRSSTESLVSATSLLRAGVRRSRRGRAAGYPAPNPRGPPLVGTRCGTEYQPPAARRRPPPPSGCNPVVTGHPVSPLVAPPAPLLLFVLPPVGGHWVARTAEGGQHGLHQSVDGVHLRLCRHLEAGLPDRGRRDRTDGGDHRGAAAAAQEPDRAFDRRRRGEDHGVGPAGCIDRSGVGVAGPRAVRHHLVDRPPLGPEPRDQPATHRLRPGEEDCRGAGPPLRPARSAGVGPGESVGQSLGHRDLRHQVGDDAAFHECPCRPHPHRSPAHGRGDSAATEGRQQPVHRIGGGDDRPPVPTGDEAVGRLGQGSTTVRGLGDGDDRELHHLGPEGHQAIDQARRLGTGTGDHHAPAGQRECGQQWSGPSAVEPSSKAATGPTTITDGAGRATEARPSRVVRTTSWPVAVPPCTPAAGGSGRRPLAISRAAISARSDTPIRMTRVPPALPRACQSTLSAAEASPTRPVTTVTDVDSVRWVTGMPAAAGAANAEVTPGTTS